MSYSAVSSCLIRTASQVLGRKIDRGQIWISHFRETSTSEKSWRSKTTFAPSVCFYLLDFRDDFFLHFSYVWRKPQKMSGITEKLRRTFSLEGELYQLSLDVHLYLLPPQESRQLLQLYTWVCETRITVEFCWPEKKKYNQFKINLSIAYLVIPSHSVFFFLFPFLLPFFLLSFLSLHQPEVYKTEVLSMI